jgi:hypothetical protein
MIKNSVVKKTDYAEVIYLCQVCKNPLPTEVVLAGPAVCGACLRKAAQKENRKPKLVLLVYDLELVKIFND